MKDIRRRIDRLEGTKRSSDDRLTDRRLRAEVERELARVAELHARGERPEAPDWRGVDDPEIRAVLRRHREAQDEIRARADRI